MKTVHFPRWAEVLEGAELSASVRASYRVTIRWYLSWCAGQGVGCSNQSAHNFVAWAEVEKNASEWAVGRWKEALRWFFVAGRAQVDGYGREQGQEFSADGASERIVRDEAGDTRDAQAEVRMDPQTDDEVKILAYMRRTGKALRTERSYIAHYRDFVRRSGLADGSLMSGAMVKDYLNYLAMERKVASSTQKVALNALVYIARDVFEMDLGDIGDFVRAQNRQRIPVVMSKEETRLFLPNSKVSRD